MSKDYLNREATQVRRTDRAVDDASWMRTFLHNAAVGTLATLHGDQPFVNTNLFVYDEQSHSIILHTARVGRTRANIERRSKVCFSVMELGRLLPAQEALEFSAEYAGRVAFGSMRIVSDVAEATVALQLLMDKYAPHLCAGRDYRPPTPEEINRTSVFRMDIESWSAKKKEVDDDFAGAYFYSERPMLRSNQTASRPMSTKV